LLILILLSALTLTVRFAAVQGACPGLRDLEIDSIDGFAQRGSTLFKVHQGRTLAPTVLGFGAK